MRIGTRIQIIAASDRRVVGHFQHEGEVVTVQEAAPFAGKSGIFVGCDISRPERGYMVQLDSGRTVYFTRSELEAES